MTTFASDSRWTCWTRRLARPGTFNIEIKDRGDYLYFYDEWGIGWHMPKDGGFFYDMFDHPLKNATTVEEIDKFPWPDPTDPSRFADCASAPRHVAEVEGQGGVPGWAVRRHPGDGRLDARLRELLSGLHRQPGPHRADHGHRRRHEDGVLGEGAGRSGRIRRRRRARPTTSPASSIC